MYRSRHLLNATSSAAASTMLRNYPRPTKFDRIYSSIQGSLSLILDQRSRDQFLARVNSGVINPKLIERFEMERYLPFTLHHDLNNPLFQVNEDLDIEDFVEGVTPALKNYEDVLTELECRNFSLPLAHNGDSKEQVTDGDGDGDGDDDTSPPTGDLGSYIKSLDSEEDDEENSNIDTSKWDALAKDSPDSLEGHIYNMMDKECLDMLFKTKRSIPAKINTDDTQNGQRRYEFEENSSEIQGACISHARAIELIPGEEEILSTAESQQENDDDNMTDDSFSHGIEKEYPVAAAINVIYIVKQTFKVISNSTTTTASIAEDKAKSQTKEDDVEDNSSEGGESMTSWAFRSAVFTTWLRNHNLVQGKKNIPIQWTLSGQATFPFPPDLTARPTS